jgi:hypothetical protein
LPLSVFVLLFGSITVLGFCAAYWRRGRMGLAGRRLGTIVIWFLLGGDVYTAYTFIAVPALVFGAGAIGFFALPYTIIVYPLVFLILRCRCAAAATSKTKLGQYLFLPHGGKAVFIGRFVAILRILAAFLAAVNRMDWRRFLLTNAAGGILWASAVGFGAYAFGKAVLRVTGPLGIALIIVSVALIIAALLFARTHEAELEARAQQALPGPLRPVHRVRARQPIQREFRRDVNGSVVRRRH